MYLPRPASAPRVTNRWFKKKKKNVLIPSQTNLRLTFCDNRSIILNKFLYVKGKMYLSCLVRTGDIQMSRFPITVWRSSNWAKVRPEGITPFELIWFAPFLHHFSLCPASPHTAPQIFLAVATRNFSCFHNTGSWALATYQIPDHVDTQRHRVEAPWSDIFSWIQTPFHLIVSYLPHRRR